MFPSFDSLPHSHLGQQSRWIGASVELRLGPRLVIVDLSEFNYYSGIWYRLNCYTVPINVC